MTATSLILDKLVACRPYYERLVEWRPRIAKGDEDAMLWSAVERNLQLALECAIDVGEMIIAWRSWERAEENRDVFRVLGERNVLPADLAQRMVAAAGLRNILVHQYGRLDRARLRKSVLEDLGDLDSFARAVASWVRAQRDP